MLCKFQEDKSIAAGAKSNDLALYNDRQGWGSGSKVGKDAINSSSLKIDVGVMLLLGVIGASVHIFKPLKTNFGSLV